MKKSLLIAGVAAIALTGCCCSRNAEEVKYEPAPVAPAAPECSYSVRDGGQVVYSERCERQISVRQVVKEQPVTCANPCVARRTSAPECGCNVQKVHVSRPVVTKRSYVLVPVNY